MCEHLRSCIVYECLIMYVDNGTGEKSGNTLLIGVPTLQAAGNSILHRSSFLRIFH